MTSSTLPLRYSASIPSRPKANLSGWFERRKGLWSIRRWLELSGSILTYRHTPRSQPTWTIDLREYRVVPGRRPCEILIYNAGADLHENAFRLFALTIGELKVWFSEMKRVSDNIHDFYHVSVQISHGSEGPISLGRDRRTDEAVAVWTHQKASAPLERLLLLTRRDETVLRAVQSHHALLNVYDIFETSRHIHTVTEFITGGPLRDRINHGGIGSSSTKTVIKDILSALVHLHDRGIIHGDVCARNIICVQRTLPSRVKLIAMGCALAKRKPKSVHAIGASDVYAAGVLLALLLTGSEGVVAMGLGKEDGDGNIYHLENGARELIAKMTAEDPRKRLSARECLMQPWLQEKQPEKRNEVKNMSVTKTNEIVEYRKVTAIVDSGSECSSAELGLNQADVKRMTRRRTSDPNTIIMDFEHSLVGDNERRRQRHTLPAGTET